MLQENVYNIDETGVLLSVLGSFKHTYLVRRTLGLTMSKANVVGSALWQDGHSATAHIC